MNEEATLALSTLIGNSLKETALSQQISFLIVITLTLGIKTNILSSILISYIVHILLELPLNDLVVGAATILIANRLQENYKKFRITSIVIYTTANIYSDTLLERAPPVTTTYLLSLIHI